MKTDGGLRGLFQKRLPQVHWQSVETWSTGQGVPDVNFCYNGVEGWIEMKKTHGWTVNMEKEQVAWIERRQRNGGRVYIAVRRMNEARGVTYDELWLFDGSMARRFLTREATLNTAVAEFSYLGRWGGGPAKWDFQHFLGLLLGE